MVEVNRYTCFKCKWQYEFGLQVACLNCDKNFSGFIPLIEEDDE